MSIESPGTTPLDRLTAHMNAADATCPDCGCHDDSGWTARTTGGRVRYRHVCPSCGAIRTRTLRLD
ncbi:MAG: HVO_0649 family zinc finger protein [Halobacteriaceae archaeon]